jgi:tRNA uracil 4-sulfurtransferase
VIPPPRAAAPSAQVTPRAQAGSPAREPREPCVLVKLGEIVLKGRNRQQFERLLHTNIRRAARELGFDIRLWQREGVILLRVDPNQVDPNHVVRDHVVRDHVDRDHVDPDHVDPDHIDRHHVDPNRLDPGHVNEDQATTEARVRALADRMRDVPGIVRVCPALRVAKDPEAVAAAAVELTKDKPGAFAVRARRRDKRFPMRSSELNAYLGTRIQQAHGYPVNLSHPHTTVFVEVDQHEVFVFTEGLHGQGGLPVGMSGRALVLMSGGIDSPVAAYRMMRRGLRCDFLHFSGMPLTGPESVYKAYALARGLDRFQGRTRLFVVAFGKAQQKLAASGADRLQIIAQRRLMLATGEILARRLGGGALVTGDSLGQVSSQTLTNITALDDATSLPILRPLIGWDKTEIMDEARRLRTLAISELPDQDCCTLLTPRRVETRARIDDLRRIEHRLDAGDLAEELAAAAQEYRIEPARD